MNYTEKKLALTQVGPPNLRPALSKKSFPVGPVGEKNASLEVGIFFVFPLISIFLNYVQGGK